MIKKYIYYNFALKVSLCTAWLRLNTRKIKIKEKIKFNNKNKFKIFNKFNNLL
jgi:hypothetical protein